MGKFKFVQVLAYCPMDEKTKNIVIPLMTVFTLLLFKGKQGVDNIKDAYLEFMKTEYNCDVKQFI